MKTLRVEEMRRAVLDDAPAVRELARQAYRKWIAVIGREPKPMGADYVRAVRENIVDLLEVDGQLAALIEMIPQTGHLLIENVAVSPEFQGQGFGRKLIAHAERLAASRGYQLVILYTNKLFAQNVMLYLRLGYEIEREDEYMGGITVYMKKTI